MPLPKDYEPRKGDVVIVHMEVDYVGPSMLKMKAVRSDEQWTESHFFDPAVIAAVKRRTWEEGERVRGRNGGQAGYVIAMHEDFAWVALDGVNGASARRTFHCNELEPEPVAYAVEGRPDEVLVPEFVPESETDESLRSRLLAWRPNLDLDERQRIAAATGLDLTTTAAGHGVTRGRHIEAERIEEPIPPPRRVAATVEAHLPDGRTLVPEGAFVVTGDEAGVGEGE